MKDIEKLIERLRKSADFEDYPIVASFAAIIEKKYLRDAATALSTLRAENEKLREKIEDARLEGYAKGLGEMSAELEQVKRECDEAVEYLRGQCRYCKRHLVCTSRKGPHSNCWEWHDQKED